MAQEYLPLTKESAAQLNYNWSEVEASGMYDGPHTEIPDRIDTADESICNKVLSCSVTGKAFKIIPQEFQFYKNLGIPLPVKSFDARHMERMTLRNPRELWNRKCDKCQLEIQTTYAPERPEQVYCEKCYNEFIYN